MKIYTKTGDDGSTGLVGGTRVSKSDLRIECYGTVDELNAAIGMAAVTADMELRPFLQAIQNELFVIGSHLATPPGKTAHLPPLDETVVPRLESQIDAAETQLTPLRNFILPGGCETAARLHLARTICRRAERSLVQLSLKESVAPVILTQINRLSDWLFVFARLANKRAGNEDILWNK
jgi:cob(I)alamin adenosyltransferase